MAVFNFTGYAIQDDYPESSQRIQFGRGYEFTSRPRGPDQILSTLSFRKGLFWVENPATQDMVANIHPTINIMALISLYQLVRMADKFQYYHPLYGMHDWKFARPLVVPPIVDSPGAIGGLGGYRLHQTAPFDVQFRLQP